MVKYIKKLPLRVICLLFVIISIVGLSFMTMAKYTTLQNVEEITVDIYPSGRFLPTDIKNILINTTKSVNSNSKLTRIIYDY